MRLVRATAVEASDTNEIASFIYNAIKEEGFIRVHDDEFELEICLSWWVEHQDLDYLEMYYYKNGTDVYSNFYDWICWQWYEGYPEDEKEIISLINDWIVKHLYEKVD